MFVTLFRIENTCDIRSPSVSCIFPLDRLIEEEMCAISFAIASGPRIRSTNPVAMAFLGMPSNFAVSGFCTMIMPFCSLIDRMPLVPSDPVPDRITATARFSYAIASDRKKISIGWLIRA